jgi:uncharacterized membrane protein
MAFGSRLWREAASHGAPALLACGMIFQMFLLPGVVSAQQQQQAANNNSSSTANTNPTGNNNSNGNISNNNYKPDSLFIALLGNGDSLVEYDIKVDNPSQDALVTLFANQDIRDLIVADYNDHVIPYEIGQARNQILVNAPNVTTVRISYSTQDLLNKTGKVWEFSLESPLSFTVKLPQDAVLTDYSGTSSPSINTVGGQYLLTYDAGIGNISYVIGVVGTEEHANVLIRAADTTIRETQSQYSNIILSDAEALLKNATTQLNAKNYAAAEQLASQANDAAMTDGRQYSDAQNSISSAESQISTASSQGNDVSNANTLLQTAKDEFSSGKYVDAKNSAADAVAAIGKAGTGGSSSDLPVSVIVASAVAAAGGVGVMIFIKMRGGRASADTTTTTTLTRPPAATISDRSNSSDAFQKREVDEIGSRPDSLPLNQPPTSSAPPSYSSVTERKPEPSPFVPEHSAAGPHADPSLLARIVVRILQERPHLRPEDQQVLQFLAEKEGAAFESEIRGKFLLPKTTIWRLVKRLEREELVEIRKAGGQNLIKLRYEGLQP